MLRWYQASLAKRPVFTQAVTSAILFATGDTLAQHAVEGRKADDHDYARTGRMALYGGAVFGPGATLWFSFLQRRIVIPSRPNLQIATMVACDQTVFAPINAACFLGSMTALENAGKPDVDVKAKVQGKLSEKWWEVYKMNLIIWPVAQAINFKYVPLQHRVLFVNFISLGEFNSEFVWAGGRLG
ncbi:MAG: Protein required for ethanol metabolism [Bogoriella megaspora]|nr:MAG: Protein required for ethanol metabolism [Bogoriella megaspora]